MFVGNRIKKKEERRKVLGFGFGEIVGEPLGLGKFLKKKNEKRFEFYGLTSLGNGDYDTFFCMASITR